MRWLNEDSRSVPNRTICPFLLQNREKYNLDVARDPAIGMELTGMGDAERLWSTRRWWSRTKEELIK